MARPETGAGLTRAPGLDADGGAVQRLFFALWPDEDVRRRLAREAHRLHAVLGGRITLSASIHLTLHFLGELDTAQADTALRVGEAIRSRAFVLRMDTLGCWPHNRIAWMAPSCVPAALAGLVEAQRAALSAAGLRVDVRAYAPHVTLLRGARCGAELPASEAFDWPVQEVSLVRSILGAPRPRYEVVAHWPSRAVPVVS